MNNTIRTRHVATLLTLNTFSDAPEAAKHGVLNTQTKAVSQALQDLKKALDKVAFLGDDHPAALSIKAAIAMLGQECSAIDAAHDSI